MQHTQNSAEKKQKTEIFFFKISKKEKKLAHLIEKYINKLFLVLIAEDMYANINKRQENCI